ncbi:hypothetical protein [Arthrobacter sp. I3]|uniref:hypothetical protein n=1 Tax=Arthrobacter sp. I3 TaxID=218158 RepID=UPI000488E05B|nr:hypothetical protein [Arthrobacter sp. I3]
MVGGGLFQIATFPLRPGGRSLALSGCGGAAPAADGSKAPSVATKTSGILNVGIDLTYPPYDMTVEIRVS